MAADRRYFVDIIGDVVSNVRAEYDPIDNEKPYYMWGHYKEIAQRLDFNENSNSVLKFKNWPLIVLMTDIEQSHGNNLIIDYTVNNAKLFIVNQANKNDLAYERKTKNFEPILYPIYELFISKLLLSSDILSPENVIEHDHIDRYAWGSQSIYGNDALIFNDYTDAIELDLNNIEVIKPNNRRCQ